VWSGSKASYTAPEPAKSITTMPGARAFGLLRQGIADCVSAGVSASDDVVSDSIALWCALHGYVALSSRSPAFPWPRTHRRAAQRAIDRATQLSTNRSITVTGGAAIVHGSIY